MKKKLMFCILGLFLLLSVIIFIFRDNITYQPWLPEQYLLFPGYASGNGQLTAIITDSSRTVAVVNNDGELVYRLHASDSAKSFTSVELVELDDENNLYIYDRRFGGVLEDNFERILKFSPKGEFLDVVYEYVYENTDFLTTRGKICNIATQGGALYLVRLEHEGFYLELINTDTGSSEIHTFFPKPNAFWDFSHCRINIDNQRIVWTTKTGSIFQYSFSGSLINEVVIDSSMFPFMAVSGNNNNLIYTDVFNGEIISVNYLTGESESLYDGSIAGAGYYYYINNKNNNIYASFNGVDVLIIAKDGTFTVIDSWLWSKNDTIKRYALFVMCIIAIILFFILLVQGILLLSKIRTSPVFKQIMLFGTCIIFGAGISSIIIIGEMQKQYTANTYNELENISRIISSSVDASVLTRLDSHTQFNDPEYMALVGHIRTVFSELQFEGKQVYLVIWMERDGVVYSMYDLEYAWGIFYPFGEYEDSFLQVLYDYKAYQHSTVSDSSGTWVAVAGPMFDKEGNFIAAIETGYNIRSVEAENRNMMIQVALIVLATTVAFLLIVIECLLMFDGYKKNKNEITGNILTELKPNMMKCIIALLMNSYSKEGEEGIKISNKFSGSIVNHLINSYKASIKYNFHPELLRAAAFFMYFSANFATAILPLYASDLYVPVLNFPREFIVTLPFTAMAVFVVISLFLVPFILGKAGVKRITLVSAILFLMGSLVCIIAENVLHLSVGYAILGLTCGAFSLIFNTIIGSQKNATDMNSGFAHLSASYLAGLNVGVVFGAMIAQFFPYRTVFYFSSGIALLFLIIIIYSVRSTLFNNFFNVQYVKEKNTKRFALAGFMFKPVVLCTLFLSLMPYMISTNFMEYFMPIFGTENGLGEANIGQLMLLNGLFAILFGAALCQLVSKKVPILISIVVPLVMISIALYLFSLNISINMLIITVVILAIVNIFAFTNIQTYFSILYQNARVSSVKALGAFSVVENMSMAIGPIIFSYILANNIGFGMKIIAGGILGCTVIFAVVSNFSVNWNYDTLEKISSRDTRSEMRAGVTHWQE
jgi:predicted MFS family arabinose efflux permease